MAYTTLEIKVNLILPLNDKTDPVRAEGKGIQVENPVGKRVGIAEERIFDAAGKLYARASTASPIFPLL